MAVVDVASSNSWSSLVRPEPYKQSSRAAYNAHGGLPVAACSPEASKFALAQHMHCSVPGCVLDVYHGVCNTA